MIVFPVYQVLPKEWVLRKGLVVFPIKVVNVTRPFLHQEAEWSLFPHVVAFKLDKISCGVPNLLC